MTIGVFCLAKLFDHAGADGRRFAGIHRGDLGSETISSLLHTIGSSPGARITSSGDQRCAHMCMIFLRTSLAFAPAVVR